MVEPVDDGPVTSLRRFFDRPPLWKAVLVIVGYLAYYLLVGRALGAVFGDEVDKDDVPATGASIFFALVLPIAIGAVTLLGFAAAIGRLRSIFARRTAVGRPWMLLSGMKMSTVLLAVVYTFGFGVCMYLAMRLTGTIWSAIALHAVTDPTTILASGGVDEAVTNQTGDWSLLASTVTILMIVFSFVAVLLVRDRRGQADSAGLGGGDGATGLSDGGGATARR